jgi:hypothetical protein
MQGPPINLQDVTAAADKFLKEYHPSNYLPIPIEEIVEIKMNIALCAIPGIKPLLGIDAFINSDFTQITVDEKSLITFTERARFSIAHEIGHSILHREWFRKHGPQNIEDYLTFHERVDTKSYKYIEIQAHTFAGLVLVPRDLLLNQLKLRLGRVPSNENAEILIPVANDLLDIFQVSGDVILRRLEREGVVKSTS